MTSHVIWADPQSSGPTFLPAGLPRLHDWSQGLHIVLMSRTRSSGPTLFSAALPKNMTGHRVSTVSSCRGQLPPKSRNCGVILLPSLFSPFPAQRLAFRMPSPLKGSLTGLFLTIQYFDQVFCCLDIELMGEATTPLGPFQTKSAEYYHLWGQSNRDFPLILKSHHLQA